MTWNPTHVGGYGPLPDSTATPLTDATQLAQAIIWRGHRIDPTGFYYLGARYYEPTSGRFLSADPMGQAGSPSLYSFCGDPVNFFDPDGRCNLDYSNYNPFTYNGVWPGFNVDLSYNNPMAIEDPNSGGLSSLGPYGKVTGIGGALFIPGTGVIDVSHYGASAVDGVGSGARLDFDFNNYEPKGTYGVIQTITYDSFHDIPPGTIDVLKGQTTPYYEESQTMIPRSTGQMEMTFNAYTGEFNMQPQTVSLPANDDNIVRFEDTPQNPVGPQQYGALTFQTVIVKRADNSPIATVNWGYSRGPNGVTLGPLSLHQGGPSH